MVILVMRCTFLLTNITVYMNESVLHVHLCHLNMCKSRNVHGTLELL